MLARIADIRGKQIVCVKNGCVFGYPSDVEFDTDSGKLKSIIIYGRPRFFGLFGRDEDIVISWEDIEVIGQETVLVNTDPSHFAGLYKKGRFF